MNHAPLPRVLVVDDDANLLAAMQRNLRKLYALELAPGGREALQAVKEHGPFAVIVTDMSMPVMNGVELLEEVQRLAPDTVRLMLTGNADQACAVAAVNRGHVHRFLNKPCPAEALIPAIDDGIRQHQILTAERVLLDQTLNGALQVLTDILAGLDSDAFGTAQLRRTLAREVARDLGVGSTWDIEIAAQLADLGRVTLPPALREKIRARHLMTANERNLIERVPEFSSRLLAHIPRLERVAQAVLCQNKNFDGSGFPADERTGADIPLGGRILRALNALLAMQQNGMPPQDAIMAIKAGPEHYDPAVARSLAVCLPLLKTAPASVATGIRAVTLDELQPGCRLMADIVTFDGVMVLASGAVLEPAHLQRLRNFAALNPVVEPITVEFTARAPETTPVA